MRDPGGLCITIEGDDRMRPGVAGRRVAKQLHERGLGSTPPELIYDVQHTRTVWNEGTRVVWLLEVLK